MNSPPLKQKKGNTKNSILSTDPEIYRQINDISRRLRIAEENYSGLRRKTQLSDQNILKTNKNTKIEIIAINSDLREIRRDIKDIQDDISQIAKEMKLFAKKSEVLVIQRYVKLFNPMRFVTPNQVKQIIKEKFEELEEN